MLAQHLFPVQAILFLRLILKGLAQSVAMSQIGRIDLFFNVADLFCYCSTDKMGVKATSRIHVLQSSGIVTWLCHMATDWFDHLILSTIVLSFICFFYLRPPTKYLVMCKVYTGVGDLK